MFGASSADAASTEECGESETDNYTKLDLNAVSSRRKLLTMRPKSCGLLCFHNGTEESMWLFVQRNATKGNPQSVLDAVDTFCYSRHWLVTVFK